MAKTGKIRMQELLERESYCKDDSMIHLNRAFAERIVKMIPGTIAMLVIGFIYNLK